MKRSNWIKMLSVPSIAVAAATPLITLSGCGNHEMDMIAKLMTETAVNELYELIKIPHVTWMEGCPTPKDDWFDIDFSKMQKHFKDILIEEFGQEYAEANFHAQDKYQNCWFDIPASEGCELRPKLLLQAHMDMMWATKEGSIAEGWTNPWEKWDEYNVPLTIDKVNGHEALHTEGYITNNGSDDAQGLAVIAAVTRLHDKFKHGPIRCLLTNLEEVGAAGIEELPESVASGYENILNLDGNMLGDITFSTAGACWGDYTADNKDLDIGTNWTDGFYRIKLYDGYGGHSGIDMHNNRESALYSLITFLWEINLRWASGLKAEIELISIKHKEEEGSSAISSEATIDFIVRNKDLPYSTIEARWEQERASFSKRYNDKMKAPDIEFIPGTVNKYVKTVDSNSILSLILEMDYGIKKQIDDLGVVTSRNITASLDLDATEKNLHIDAMGRSAYLEDLNKIESDYAKAKEKCEEGGLPLSQKEHTKVLPWYQPDTILKSWYKESCKQAGFKTHDVMVHGGAEASVFVKKNPKANIICIGSTLLGEHTINEVLYLDDYEQYIKSLLFLFKKVSEYDPPTPVK